MIDITICDLKTNNNQITYNTILSTCFINVFQKTINKHEEEIIFFIKEYCRKFDKYFDDFDFKEWFKNDETIRYSGNNINLYNIVTTISWYSNDDKEQKQFIDKLIPLFTNNKNEIKVIKEICNITMYLKKGNDKYNYELNNNNQEIVKSYQLFLQSSSFEDALNINIINIKQNNINSYLPSLFAYAYYKYISPNLMQESLSYLSKNKHYFILNELIDLRINMDYETVTAEIITEQTKYIALQYTVDTKDFIDFYHSKDLKVLINYLVFQDFKIFNLGEDEISLEELDLKNYNNFYEYQKGHFSKDLIPMFDEIKKISAILLDNKDDINILKEQLIIINEILNKLGYSYKYIYFNNPSEVVNYILKNYNFQVDIYKNILRYCLND